MNIDSFFSMLDNVVQTEYQLQGLRHLQAFNHFTLTKADHDRTEDIQYNIKYMINILRIYSIKHYKQDLTQSFNIFKTSN